MSERHPFSFHIRLSHRFTKKNFTAKDAAWQAPWLYLLLFSLFLAGSVGLLRRAAPVSAQGGQCVVTPINFHQLVPGELTADDCRAPLRGSYVVPVRCAAAGLFNPRTPAQNTDPSWVWTATNGPGGERTNALLRVGNALYAGTNRAGVQRTFDNGQTWTRVGTPETTGNIIETLIQKDGALFSGAFAAGVARSTDNGANWVRVNNGLSTQVLFIWPRAFAVSGNNLFMGANGDSVFRTSDNGANWTKVSSGLSANFARNVKALASLGTAIFAGTDGGVYRTVNQGQEWLEVNTGLAGRAATAFAVIGTRLFVGTDAGVFLTINNGASWTPANSGIANLTINALAAHENALFAATVGGVYRSLNDGQSWTQINTGLTDLRVYALAVTDTKLFAGTESGVVFSSNLALAVVCHTAGSLNPASGAPGATVTITGTNLTGVNAVRFSSNVTTQFTVNNDTQITANVPAGAVTGPITLGKVGCADVQTAAFTVTQPQNPVPASASLNPNMLNVGGAAFTLTVIGANFINSSVVRWNGAARPTTFVSATQLMAAIPASDLATAGTAQVTVFNPAPGGGVSNALSFNIAQPSPAPVVNSLNPNPLAAGGPAFALTVNGANFVIGAVVRWNGSNRSTTFFNSTRLGAAIPAADLANPGTARITVFNPPPGGGPSNEATLTIRPAFVSVSAASFLANELAPEAIVAGFSGNLAATTQAATTTPLPTTLAGVTLNIRDSAGTERQAPLFFVAPMQINYQIPPNTASGAALVTVRNAATDVALGTLNIVPVAPGLFSANSDGQGVAAGVALRVRNEPPPNPTPALTSLSPNVANAGSAALTLTVNGGAFVNGASVRWNDNDRTTTFVSATQLRATLPASDLATPGTANVTVFNPAPGGGVSGALTFSLNNPAPSLSSLSHRTTTSGEAGFLLTVNGSGFVANSVVRWNGQGRATTFVSATQLHAEILAADLSSPDTGVVTVFNPPPGGGSSGSLSITIFDGSRDIPLTSGVTVNGSFDAPPPGAPPGACGLRVFPQYTIQAPAGATQLRLALTSTEDLDSYARFAQRVDVTSTIVADYRANGLGGNETITITPNSSPPLQEGKYFVLVASCSRVAATFTLTATVTDGAAAELAETGAQLRSGENAPSLTEGEGEPAYFFAPRAPEPAAAVYDAAQWFWRWGVWTWLPPALEIREPEQPVAATDRPAGLTATIPQQQQTFEPLARFDTALNRFVAAPLDLAPLNDEVFLILFGTGMGLRNAANAVTARIGGLSVPVGFAGPAPGLIGVEQFNIGPLPRPLIGRGEVEVMLTVDGRAANTVSVAVR